MEGAPDRTAAPGKAAPSTSKKWWIGAVVIALLAGAGVGLGVGLGLRPKAGPPAPVAAEPLLPVPHRELRNRAARSRPSIVLIGDGLTESGFSYNLGGWGARLVGSYQRKADLINRGFGGYFTNWFKDYMLDELFDVHDPVMGIVFLGVKDSQVKNAAGKAFTPPPQFRDNVDAIMAKGKQAGVRYWLVITPPPVIETPGKPGARTMNNTRLYVDELQALAKKYGGTMLDIFSSWQRIPGWQQKFINPDKLHLNAGGNEKLWSDTLNTIKAHIPEMDPLKMPWQFPSMLDIDRENPGPSFQGLEQ